ncbi:MAG: AI-2E family transporter [Catenulispora sp.]|nr:AI-2E family transporter [Catenulispora sp.]
MADVPGRGAGPATSTRAPQPGSAGTAGSSAGGSSSAAGSAAADADVTSLSAMPAGGWFTFAFWLAAGAITAYALVRVVSGLGSLLSILLLAVFFATALDPMVTALVNRGLRRSLAVTVVALGVLGVLAGFVAVIFPPVDREVNSLINAIPGYLDDLRNKSTYLGSLENKYHLVEKAKSWIDANKAGTLDLNGILGAGKAVFSILTGTLTAIALTLYFVANMPGIKRFSYHLVPVRRRPRVAELTDRILAQVGRYVIGQMVIASIGGVCTWVWAMAWDIPYPAALGIVVAVFGLVPVIGSSIGGAVVTLVALTVSVKVSIATLVYYVAARLAEDYLVAPRVNRRTVDVHPMVTIVAVLVGGALFGVVGALVAIPAAVAIKLIATEVLLPRIDEM